MQCTFCGTENRAEYKFCGMCGVRLERRHGERRVKPSGASTKCACGFVNEPGFKFCGMCGTRIDRRMQDRRSASSEERAVAIANAQLPTPETTSRPTTKPVSTKTAVAEPEEPVLQRHRTEPSIFRNEPSESSHSHISGPSFLGLSTEPEGGDGEYLLEDEPSRGGLRKLVLFVIIAAILGLIFVQWRSSFKASPKPAAPKAEPAGTPVAPQSDNQPPASGAADQHKQESTVSADSPVPSSSAATSEKTEAEPVSTKADSSKTDSSKTDSTDKDKTSQEPAKNSMAEKNVAEKKDDDGKKTNATTTDVKAEAKLPDYKPSAALLRAQQYLQGRGVAQNCEQGMLYLHAATEKADPGAAIQMAALYSSGHCVKQDRVMAYRWFNSAHELEPANMWIQKNMDQLWAQMSSQERRLAGY